MINKKVDIAIIGGGPAGLSAAISAKKSGVNNVILFDRNSWLGGILPQCIHDGFSLDKDKLSYTGPEYADIFIKESERLGIDLLTETNVLKINKNKIIVATNKKGIYKIKAKAIILAMGCREKTRPNLMIPGDRPSGIYTAGLAQAFINLYNILPGKNIIILGSGDVGLIMARRLKLEGVNVIGVVEILSYPGGLPRNVVQCLNDYNIPLLLNHTITKIEGKERLEKVTIAKVDKYFNTILGTERKIKCDTLLLSVGLIPENELSKTIGIEIDERTNGPIVNQDFETSISGIFACGNCLQVYDSVEDLNEHSIKTGINAKNHINSKNFNKNKNSNINIIPGKGLKYILPQQINRVGLIEFNLRVNKPIKSAILCVRSKNKIIFKRKLFWLNPSILVKIEIPIKENMGDMEVFLLDE